MGSFAGNTLIDTMSRRLRDTANLGYSRVFILDILNRTQNSLNAYLGLVHTSATFTTTHSPIYAMTSIGTDVVRIVDIRDGDRILTPMAWGTLVYQDARWFRLRGPQAEAWAPIGRDLFAVIPASQAPRTLTAVYVQQLTNLADAATPLSSIPDEHKDLWLDLAEAVLLFRGREFIEMQRCLQRVMPALGIDDSIQVARRGGAESRG